MSIKTEIERITQAKVDLKTAIETKEVIIEENATIDTYARKVDEVYNAGYEKGKAESGGDSYYDLFWDEAQKDPNFGIGVRKDYRNAFRGGSWNEKNFKPKYDIKPTMAEYIFSDSLISGDLVEICKNQNIELDFSNCSMFAWAFYATKFTRLGVIDMSKASSAKNADNVFRVASGAYLTTIDKLIVPEKYSLGTSSFQGCSQLTNITIEGIIIGNFTISSSPLTTESMKSIITHLADYSGTDKEFTYSVTFKSTCWEALDAEGTTSPNENTWREYINDLGWNVG